MTDTTMHASGSQEPGTDDAVTEPDTGTSRSSTGTEAAEDTGATSDGGSKRARLRIRTSRAGVAPTGPDTEAAPTSPAPAPGAEPTRRTRRPRTSALVLLGLVLTVSAALTALTSVLAPLAIVLAAAGVLASGAGLSATRKPHVTGRVTAILAICLGLAVAVVAGAELVGGIAWLDHTDQAGRLRDWLDAHVPIL